MACTFQQTNVGGQKGQWNGEGRKTHTNFDDTLIFCELMWCTYTLSFCFFNIVFIFLWQHVLWDTSADFKKAGHMGPAQHSCGEGRPCTQRFCRPKSPTKPSQMVTFGLDMSAHKEGHTKCSLVLHHRWRTSSLREFISCVHSQRVNLNLS